MSAQLALTRSPACKLTCSPGVQETQLLQHLFDTVRDGQRTFMFIVGNPDKTAALTPVTDAAIRSQDLSEIGEVLNKYLRSEEGPPQNVLEALEHRLKEAGAEITDPLQLLQLLDEDWSWWIQERNRRVHQRMYDTAKDAHVLVKWSTQEASDL